jgi:hypothetical protein
MSTLAPKDRGLALFAAIVILAATTTIAEARMGGPGIGGPGQGMTMNPVSSGRPGRPNLPAPPIPSLMGEPRGTTGGFAPGGGSPTKPNKKPNLQ